ncbi:hypothetical protein ACS5NO_13745 [Larkinella sp. GY13]|uniref:hypothetical protein n=1 Tax=Larkinella sp. GY13 TaxID=3453720 RepID=UPI003EEFADF8
MLKRPHTQESKDKISKANLGRAKSASHRNNQAKSKGARPFYVFRGDDPKPVGKYYSANQANRELDDITFKCIRACLLGKQDSSKGYRFVYEENLIHQSEHVRYQNFEREGEEVINLYKVKGVQNLNPVGLKDVITKTKRYSNDFKALVLRMLEQYKDINTVAHLSCVPAQTIFVWLVNWNKKQETGSTNEQNKPEEVL